MQRTAVLIRIMRPGLTGFVIPARRCAGLPAQRGRALKAHQHCAAPFLAMQDRARWQSMGQGQAGDEEHEDHDADLARKR